jgi:hypothetical protein
MLSSFQVNAAIALASLWLAFVVLMAAHCTSFGQTRCGREIRKLRCKDVLDCFGQALLQADPECCCATAHACAGACCEAAVQSC